jgi:UDP-glucose 4-epimerase
MKILVTGGQGFIGSHIVDKLVDLGHDVLVIDNNTSEIHEEFLKNPKAQYVNADCADYDRTLTCYYYADIVYHCAAESRIQPSINNPLLSVRTNTLGTATVLQCAREAGVRKVIYSSTSSAYGGVNPYAYTKVAGERMCEMYTDLFGLKTIIFRYFNVYGPREPLKGPYAPVVGLFLRQLKAGEPLTIVSPGTQRRDFIHVDDVVRANIMAMDNDNHGIYNLGFGKNYSMLELAEMIGGDTAIMLPRKGEADTTLADISKTTEVFGWKPTKKLETYIENAIRNL